MNKIVRSKEQIMNKTFLAMMGDLGFDVELHYVERKDTKWSSVKELLEIIYDELPEPK